MKVIRPGNPPWWIGQKLECPVCKRLIELEDGDQNSTGFIPLTNDVGWVCTCGGTMAVTARLERGDR